MALDLGDDTDLLADLTATDSATIQRRTEHRSDDRAVSPIVITSELESTGTQHTSVLTHTFIAPSAVRSLTMASNGDRDGETQSLLLEAAYHTLCEHGYADFSLRKVAAQADKSRGLVHYHYDSKTDLLVSVLDYLISRFEDRFAELPDQSAVDRLDEILEWVAFGPRLFGRDGDAYFTAIFELRAQAPYDDAIRERLTQNFETVRDRIAAVITAGIDDGELVPVEPEPTATLLVVAVDGARNTDLTMNADGTVDATLAAIETFVFDSLRAQ